MYLIMFLISEDETTLMMKGAENEENAIFTIFMYVYDKALSFTFLSLPLLQFLATFRFRIKNETDRINIKFSIVDQRIKVSYRVRCIQCIDNS